MESALSSQALISQRASHRSCSPTCGTSHTIKANGRSPTGCVYLLFQGYPCFLAISPEIATFIPQEATPASGHSALWRESVEGQQRAWTCLQAAFWRQNIPVNLLGKMNMVEPCNYKKWKSYLFFYSDIIIVTQECERGNVCRQMVKVQLTYLKIGQKNHFHNKNRCRFSNPKLGFSSLAFPLLSLSRMGQTLWTTLKNCNSLYNQRSHATRQWWLYKGIAGFVWALLCIWTSTSPIPLTLASHFHNYLHLLLTVNMMHLMPQFIQTGPAAVGALLHLQVSLMDWCFLSQCNQAPVPSRDTQQPLLQNSQLLLMTILLSDVYFLRNVGQYSACTHIFNRKPQGFEIQLIFDQLPVPCLLKLCFWESFSLSQKKRKLLLVQNWFFNL